MKTPLSIVTDSTITAVIDNKPYVIGNTHPSFYEIKAKLLNKDFDDLEELFDVKEGYKSYSNGLIEIEGSNLLYNGLIIHNVLAQRIVDMIQNGDVVEPMIEFLKNVMKNPSEGSADQLYTFLEHKNLPFTEDGCFLAYKAINANYTDKWTGGVSNKIGETVTMEREDVTADPEKGCSSGLHCGSIEYVRSYGHFPYGEDMDINDEGEKIGDRLITVKVNPADVVSVPTDCSCQKLRTFKYVVHEEIENPYSVLPKYEAPVYYEDEDEDYEDNEWDEDEFTEFDDEEDYTSEGDVLWDTEKSTKDDKEELKDFMGHPSGDFGGARINVLHTEEELAGIGDMDFLGEGSEKKSVSSLCDITPEGEIIDIEMIQAMYGSCYGYTKTLNIHATPPKNPGKNDQLPPPPPEIIINEDVEETTIDTNADNTDGLILPENTNKN
jgi:hypothetical protein